MLLPCASVSADVRATALLDKVASFASPQIARPTAFVKAIVLFVPSLMVLVMLTCWAVKRTYVPR